MGQIEINGKKYDAQTGRLLNVDGVIQAQVKPEVKPVTQSKVRPVRIKVDTSSSKEVQKSKTLARSAVKKPEIQAAKHDKTHEKPVVRGGEHVKKRQHRSKGVKQSSLIKHFNHAIHAKTAQAQKEIVKYVEDLEVAAEPIIESKIVRDFEEAVENATSHLEEFVDEQVNSKRNRRLAFASVSLVTLLVVGFAAYSVVPQVRVKLAGAQAGFSPEVPSYSPAGYGLGKNIETAAGEITLNYQSRTDDKIYKIKQSPTAWTNQTLLNKYILAENKPYQTYETQGQTVYVYDNSQATWVNDGIWYRLEGNAILNTDQLLRIASGL